MNVEEHAKARPEGGVLCGSEGPGGEAAEFPWGQRDLKVVCPEQDGGTAREDRMEVRDGPET